MDDPVGVYGWIESDAVMDAVCVSVAVGADLREVVETFACDPSTRRLATYAVQADMSAPYPEGGGNDTVQVNELGGAVVCVEANGWGGVDQRRAQRLSRRGAYVAVYRNVNALMQVIHASEGGIVRDFDPLLYDAAAALPQESGLPFGHPGSPSAASFALIERLTGLRLTREWLVDEPHPAYQRDPDA